MSVEKQFFEFEINKPIVVEIKQPICSDFIDDGRIVITNTPPSVKKHLDGLTKSTTEREVEAGIRAILSLIEGIKVFPPHNNHSDGRFKYGKREAMFECKRPSYNFRNIKSYMGVVAQCVYNLRESYHNNGYIPDSIVGFTNTHYFVIPSITLLPYLSKDYDWSIQHSSANNYERIMFDLMKDKALINGHNLTFKPIYFDKNTFSIDQFIELITKNDVDYDNIHSPFFQCCSSENYRKLLEENSKNKDLNLLSKREDYLKRPEFVLGVWGRGSNKTTALQDVHTPLSLCKEMWNAITKYNITPINQKILIYNLEFIDYAYLCDIVKNNTIWFVTENRQKLEIAKSVYGDSIKYVHVDNFIKWENKVKFDVIIGNPPYNPERDDARGNSIWDDFVKKSLLLLKDGGILCYIHPNGWRKPGHELWKLLTSKQITFLKILGEDDSNKLFDGKVGTRVDWYVLQNTNTYKDTEIIDEKGNHHNINLSTIPFLPNFLPKEIFELLAQNDSDKCEIIHDGYYSTSNTDRISREKTDKHNLPVFLSLDVDNNLRLVWSDKDFGHFGIPKVICSGGRYIYTLIDVEGKYGINSQSFGIPISSKEDGEEIVRAFNSPKFKEIVKATKWSNFQTNINFFTFLRKEFWKEFLI